MPIVRKVRNEDSGSLSDDSQLDIGEDSDQSLEDFLTDMKREQIEPVEYQIPVFQENIKKDTFVLVTTLLLW